MAQNDSEATKQSNELLSDSKKIMKKQGHWNEIEHKTYLKFLQDNKNHTKGQRLFKKMSQIVGTRTPSQCRSHHQKFNPQKTKCLSETGILRSKQYARQYFAQHKTQDNDSE
ncbi:unnamed protein product [Paramecium primaurelia]|uniref:Myb-like domain-containing protein n=1 Tax=Paramecium primaurelia TaxID=5886 RepID=A0A8S1QC30_PARPR|nr:unnamed protein product [Paramecium primaurelia]